MENDSDENKKRLENDLILRKSLLRGHTTKIARDNVKLRENLRNVAKDFLRKENSSDHKG